MRKKERPEAFFTTRLMEWHQQENKRQMPWKGEKDPYKIWLSEIILQQTRVAQGLAYYLRFIERYPDIASLAAAQDADVFKLWEGLGYYSRCRNLLVAARQMANDYNGRFPVNYSEILQLKGVGPYTAAAIASFAFGMPHAVVDGNVIRVLSRFFGIVTPFDSTAGKKQFANLAQQLIDHGQPGAYNQAIMDFGATICTPAAPLCGQCPLQPNCFAYQHKQTGSLPVKGKKLVRKTRFFCYWLINAGGKILVRERLEKDIWQHLYEFYLTEDARALEWDKAATEKMACKMLGTKVEVQSLSPIFTQQLTHQTIHARFVQMKTVKCEAAPAGYEWKPIEALKNLAFPKTITAFMGQGAGREILLF